MTQKTRFAWAPVPVLLLGIAVLWTIDVPAYRESLLLGFGLYFLSATLVSLFIAYLAGRSFLLRGTPGSLMLGCGALIWGISGIPAYILRTQSANATVTVHNVCMLLSAACHFAGATLTVRRSGRWSGSNVWLGAAYTLTAGMIALVTIATDAGWLPVFFIEGYGGTPIRQLTLVSTIVLLLATAAIFGQMGKRRASAFSYWYALGLLLIAIGLFGVMTESNLGTALNWTGRIAQAVGGIYLLIAALASLRESPGEGISLEAALTEAQTRYERLIELAADGIALHEPASEGGRLIEVNQALCDLLGYTAAELCKLTIADIVAPQAQPAPRGTDAIRRETVLVTKTGANVQAEINSRLFEQRGQPMVLSVIRDIGDRNRAEVALRRSESMLVQAQRVANMGSWEWNFETGDVLWSDQVYRMFGVQRDTFRPSRESFLSIVDPGDRDRVAAAIAAAFDGRSYRVEWKRPMPDGSVRRMLSQAEISRDSQGKPVRMIGAVLDVTEQRRRDEQLHEISQRLTYHVEHSPVAVIEFGPDLELIRWSGEAERIFGWKADEVLGKSMYDIPWIHEDDAESVREVSVDLRSGSNPRRFSSNRNYRKDGSVVYCEWYNSSLLDASGTSQSILSLVLDVTERKRVEQELRESEEKFTKVFQLNAAPISISRLEDGRVIDVNEAWEEVFGFSRSEVIGRIHSEVSFQNAQHLGHLAVELKAHGSITNREVDFLKKNGGTWTALTSAEVITLHGEAVVVSSFVDITERKRSEERMREAQKLESLGLLAGGVAHDFNNLLVGVIGNASLAQDMLPAGHPAAQLLARVVKTGEQAAHLTRQMLAYSGKGRFVVEPVNLSTLIPEINGLVQPSISNKVALCFELSANLPAIEADRGQMQQIYMNLMLNAAEAIGDDNGVITVRTSVRESADIGPGRHVALEVIDTGCGMDEATRARIFDPFFTTKFTGRGLGLAAVSGIVRAHRGSISVESAPGRGSTFTVLLPSTESAAEVPASAVKAETPRPSGTVLVVDDEAIVREMAAKALKRSGFTVLTADGGLAAVEVLRERRDEVSLVLLDLSMPGMGGQETLPELRRLRPDLKILVSSGYSERETMLLFQGCDVSGFVQKPYTARNLVDVVSRSLSKATAE